MNGKKYFSTLNIVKAILVIVGMFGALYGSIAFIDSRIENKITDSEYIKKVASQVRPAIIFNSKGSILLDMGGLQYLEKITVVPGADNTKSPKIIVTPKRYMAHAPLLTSMKLVHMILSVERGENNNWEYILGNFIETIVPRILPIEEFKLEIISK